MSAMIEIPRTNVVDEHDTLTIDCRISGPDVYSIGWNTTGLISETSVVNNMSLKLSTLTLFNVSFEDFEKNLTCYANNEAGRRTMNSELIVNCK